MIQEYLENDILIFGTKEASPRSFISNLFDKKILVSCNKPISLLANSISLTYKEYVFTTTELVVYTIIKTIFLKAIRGNDLMKVMIALMKSLFETVDGFL